MKKALFASALLSALATPAAFGQLTTTADAITASSMADDPQDFLYATSPALPANRAAVGTEIWFVADGGTLGVPTGQVSFESITAIANGTADDKLFTSALVDGLDTVLNLPGRFQQSNLTYPTTAQSKPVYVYLWDDSHGGDLGDTFGLLELTLANGRIVAPSGLGNFEFHINAPIFADSFTVVPEPAATASIAGLLCVAGLGLRALRRRANR